MMFRNTLTITAYTYEPNHYEFYRLRPAIKDVPTWFSDLPTSFTTSINNIDMPTPTAKTCPAILGTYKKAISIPCQSDIIFKCDTEKDIISWVTPNVDASNRVKTFNEKQKGGYTAPHVKIDSTWILCASDDTDFLIDDAYYNNYDRPWRVIPGVLNFKYQNTLAINMELKNQEDQYMIEAGTPLALMYPISKSSIKLEHKLIPFDEWNRLRTRYSARNVFLSKYFKQKKHHANLVE